MCPLLICLTSLAQEQSTILTSKQLSKNITIITYDTDSSNKNKPMVYVTDGKKFIKNGSLNIIKKLSKEEKIPKAFYVFVSTIDPKTGKDNRNNYFFNNPKYLAFFEEELLPTIEKSIGQTFNPEDRSLIGISFGGLNGAYFSAKSSAFKNFGLLSPVIYPKKEELMKAITFSKNKDLNIFLSTGTNDAESYFKDLKAIYTSKNYVIKTLETKGGHDFKNWNGQLETLFNFLNSR